MSTSRRLGALVSFAAFVAVCVMALAISGPRGFNGMQGIQSDLATKAGAIVFPVTLDASVTAEGRNLTVRLPDTVATPFDRSAMLTDLRGIEGVRSVELIGDPSFPDTSAPPAPQPTIAAEPPVEPEPTETPTPEPAAQPTPAPQPTEAPTPEPAPLTATQALGAIADRGIEFEPGLATLTSQGMELLDQAAEQLADLEDTAIEVQAHTDNVGDPDVNFILSQDRAEAVVTYLIDQGVDAALLTPRGFGASKPIADNDTEQGRADNQRVAFVVEGN